MNNYQLKLDLGEGQECHKAYEDFLDWTEQEDSNELWVVFTKCWQIMKMMEDMEEAKNHTLQ